MASAVGNGWSIIDIANKFGGGKGIKEMPSELEGTWNDAIRCLLPGGCGEDNPYNKCCNFKIPDPSREGKYKYLPWPADLIVKPVEKGKYWDVFHQQ